MNLNLLLPTRLKRRAPLPDVVEVLPTGGAPGGYFGAGGQTYYLSPSGSNSNAGTSSSVPWKTFAYAFANMAAGDQLLLMDGTYSNAAGTGVIHWNTATYGANAANTIPNGISLARSTRIKAVNDGQVIISAPLFIGRSFRADNYIEVWGCKFTGGGQIYNGNYCTLKNCAFDGAFGIGTNDHTMGTQYNLVEDCWAWAAQQRVIVSNYRANKNTWRRFVVRGDGGGLAGTSGSGNPNVGITVYDSQDTSLLNVLVVDRILATTPYADYPYGDFATAQHTSGMSSAELGRNKWLGCMSVNSMDSALTFEADVVIAGATTWTIQNFVAVCKGGTNSGGVNVGATGPTVISNITATNTGVSSDGIRVAPSSPGTSVTNVLVRGYNRALNSSITPQYTSVYGATLAYNQTTPTVGVKTANQFADGATPSLKYPTRIEAGSALKAAGSGGAPIGATVMYCYGVNGSRYGDPDVETLTAYPLWPYPNEDRIKADMGAAANGARGFCTGNSLDGNPQSLTKYIWEQYGNQAPANYYA